MKLDYSKAMPVVIESEAVPKDCLLLITPPERFVASLGMSQEDVFFEFLMQCKPSVITNIGEPHDKDN